MSLALIGLGSFIIASKGEATYHYLDKVKNGNQEKQALAMMKFYQDVIQPREGREGSQRESWG